MRFVRNNRRRHLEILVKQALGAQSSPELFGVRCLPLSCMTNVHAAMLPSVLLVGDVTFNSWSKVSFWRGVSESELPDWKQDSRSWQDGDVYFSLSNEILGLWLSCFTSVHRIDNCSSFLWYLWSRTCTPLTCFGPCMHGFTEPFNPDTVKEK